MEVITGGGQHGVNGIAGMVCKIIAAHAVLGLEMTDHWFDGGRMEKGKATGSEMGTDPSTHNPSENTPIHDPSEKR
jgi:hypothetical protein